jgi:uncharacterized membrane protein YecN with MAPEG domain
MHLPIVALYAAVNITFNVILAAGVTRARAKANVFLGTGDNADLLLASRRHANNMEYVPLGLIALTLAELNGGAVTPLHVFGGLLTVGRLMHAVGVGSKPSPLRALGAVLTWLSLVGAAIYSAYLSMH